MSIFEHFGFYDNMTSYKRHSHLLCEMIFVTDGLLTMTCGDNDFIAEEGQLLLVPVDIPHSTEKISKPYKRWLIEINPWELARVYVLPQIQGMISGMVFKSPIITDLPDGNRIIQAMYNELADNKNFAEQAALGGLIYMLAAAARENLTSPNTEFSEAVKTVMNVRQYIYQNYANRLKMDEVAEMFFTNKFYLTHIFTEHTGISPKKFQINCRLENAERLLKNTTLNVSEVGEKCGFASLSDFTRRFKEMYGFTPAEYRKI